MFKALKKSSLDKSASLGRSSSLRSTSNDAGTVTNEFGYFQDRLESLNQLYGDIKNIRTYLDPSIYTAAQDKYKRLHDEIKKDRILKPEETKQLLFKTYEYQAISAFRAGKFQEHNKHLLHAYDRYGPAIDQSIIGLERWVEIYKTLGVNAKDVPSISPQYDSLLKKVETEVQSLIKAGKYDQARTKMEYLNKNSHNFQIFELYASTIEDTVKAFKCLKDKSDMSSPIQRQDIYDIFKKWQDKFNKAGDTELAAEAATCASKYNPNPTATAFVTPAVKKAEKEVEKLKEQLEKASNKLETAITLDEQQKQIKELTAKHEAELEKLRTEHKAELEVLKPKTSPTKDTKVDEAGDFSPTSSLPPPYTSVDIASSPYLQLAAKNAPTAPTIPTAPVVKVVTPLAPEVLDELTKLAHLIPSLNWQDSKYNTTKDKAKKLLNEAVKENPDVYKTIEDSKILVLLADVLLSSNKMEEARIVCRNALDADPNIWQATDDQIVLLNLAGVLLPSNQSSDQLKAEQIYSKAISIRIYFKDERGNYEMDVNRTTIVSKTVAQDGYSAAERDCLVKVCLSSNKVYQQAQALDCYPHTDVAKREAIAGQLKQLAKQMLLPVFPSYAAYTLYSKASSVLKDDLELRQDMKKTYEYTCPYTALPKYSTKYSNYYPPTEESTTYLTGECANSDY